jgi:hypothetical protein
LASGSYTIQLASTAKVFIKIWQQKLNPPHT